MAGKAQSGEGGPALGILMLDSRFPRIPGDIGNPDTWPFPVRYRTVPGATPGRVVLGPSDPFLSAFVAAGRALAAEGCGGLATTCGFLAPLQARLAAEIGVPVAASALIQAPMIVATLPAGQGIGIVTISAETLTKAHLDAAGLAQETPISGTDPSGEFSRAILTNAPEMDIRRAEADVVAAAERVVAAHPAVGAILLECTNMVPYAPAVQAATGRPVYSIYTCLVWFHAALRARRFPAPATVGPG